MIKTRFLLSILILFSFLLIGCDIEEAPAQKETQIEPEAFVEEEIPKEEIEAEITEEAEEIKTEEEISEETEAIEEEPITLPVEPGSLVHDIKEPEFELFNPTLTYPDAYNGPLYATWEHMAFNDEATYFNNLNRNGVNFIIGAFSILGKQSADILTNSDGLGKVVYLVQKYPSKVVPVFSTGMGGASERNLVGDKLTSYYQDAVQSSKQIAGDVLRGFGEIETQEWPMSHNDPKIMQLFSLADSNNLFVMFHPKPGQKNAIKDIIETYPNTIFVIHMYPEDFSKDRSNIIDLMNMYGNLYFSIDADHTMFDGQIGLLYKYEGRSLSSAKSSFISDFDSNHKSLLNSAVSRYKPLVDAVPDKVFWGTESSLAYNFEPEVYDRIIKYSRMFTGKLNPEHQEMVAYKNALRVFGQGVKLDEQINVIDTVNWPQCTSTQSNQCEKECESAGPEESLENEMCFSPCLIKLKCIEVLEED